MDNVSGGLSHDPPTWLRGGVTPLEVVRLFGPEREFGIALLPDTLEIELIPLRRNQLCWNVSGRVFRERHGPAALGFEVVVELVGEEGVALGTDHKLLRRNETGVVDCFYASITLDAGCRPRQLRITFRTKELVACSKCGAMTDRPRKSDGWCWHCGWSDYNCRRQEYNRWRQGA